MVHILSLSTCCCRPNATGFYLHVSGSPRKLATCFESLYQGPPVVSQNHCYLSLSVVIGSWYSNINTKQGYILIGFSWLKLINRFENSREKVISLSKRKKEIKMNKNANLPNKFGIFFLISRMLLMICLLNNYTVYPKRTVKENFFPRWYKKYIFYIPIEILIGKSWKPTHVRRKGCGKNHNGIQMKNLLFNNFEKLKWCMFSFNHEK